MTSIFVHSQILHLVGNTFFLWFFGKRLERVLGAWTLLFFYLSCGLAGNVVTLAVYPEAMSYGASGAVYGLAGGLVGVFGLRVQTLSMRQWWKLGLLVLWIAWTIHDGFSMPEINNSAHLGGLFAGLFLGAALAPQLTQTANRRRWAFAGMALLLLGGAILVRHWNRYAVHVDSAARALDQGRAEDASRELQLALQMNPGSKSARNLVHRLEDRNGPVDGCSGLRGEKPVFDSNANPCDSVMCDGKVHVAKGHDGARISYQGGTETHKVDGVPQMATTTSVTKQALMNSVRLLVRCVWQSSSNNSWTVMAQ